MTRPIVGAGLLGAIEREARRRIRDIGPDAFVQLVTTARRPKRSNRMRAWKGGPVCTVIGTEDGRTLLDVPCADVLKLANKLTDARGGDD